VQIDAAHYAALPAAPHSTVVVRVFERSIEILDAAGQLLRRLGGPMPKDQGSTLWSMSKALFAAPCPPHANGPSPAG